MEISPPKIGTGVGTGVLVGHGGLIDGGLAPTLQVGVGVAHGGLIEGGDTAHTAVGLAQGGLSDGGETAHGCAAQRTRIVASTGPTSTSTWKDEGDLNVGPNRTRVVTTPPCVTAAPGSR